MGPTRNRGMNRGGAANAAPTAPSNGSGGAGTLATSVTFAPATSEIGDALTGRITLGMVNLSILFLLGFYLYTRSAQGGA